jgi:hypothetical protein
VSAPVIEDIETVPADQLGDDDQAADPGTVVDFPAPERAQDAPYGYLADGRTPRGKPGPKGPRTPRSAAPPPKKTAPKRTAPPSSSTSSTKAKKSGRLEALVALASVPIFAGAMAGRTLLANAKTEPQQRQAVGILASAGALAKFAEPLLAGADQIASQNPNGWLSKLLDRATEVGPYAVIATPALGLIAQLGVNFGMVPLGLAAKLGAVDPAELAESVMHDLAGVE